MSAFSGLQVIEYTKLYSLTNNRCYKLLVIKRFNQSKIPITDVTELWKCRKMWESVKMRESGKMWESGKMRECRKM